MKLNTDKSKIMIFNFTKKHKFTTQLNINDENIEVVDNIKLLGTVISSDLKWDTNISYLTKKAWKRMLLLQNAAKFTKESSDLKSTYLTFIRPVFKQSAIVWHSSLSKKNMNDLERIP